MPPTYNKDMLLDRLLFIYRLVDDDSLAALNKELMDAFRSAMPAFPVDHVEYGKIGDAGYGLKLSNTDTLLGWSGRFLYRLDIPQSVAGELGISKNELQAAIHVTLVILTAFSYQIREPGTRLSSYRDGRLRTQTELLGILAHLSRLASYTHATQIRVERLNEELEKCLTDYASETPDTLNCIKHIEYDEVYLPDTQTTRAGLKLKGKKVFVLDILKRIAELDLVDRLKVDDDDDVTLPDVKITLQVALVILELFENNLVAE